MQMAATDGIVGSPGFGRIPFAHSAAILPGVSMPSSVVRSMHRIARSSAHSFESFLIERLASEAARSSAPTWSTLRTPRMSEPRWERESAVATEPIVGGCPSVRFRCRFRQEADAGKTSQGAADWFAVRGTGAPLDLLATGVRARFGGLRDRAPGNGNLHYGCDRARPPGGANRSPDRA